MHARFMQRSHSTGTRRFIKGGCTDLTSKELRTVVQKSGWAGGLPRLLASWPRVDYCMQPIVQHAADVSALIHCTGCAVLLGFGGSVPYLALGSIFLQLMTILAKPCSSRYVEDLLL
jgi:hypothetical protein